MTIFVTSEDIALGVAGNYYLCPVARALKRTLDDPGVAVRSCYGVKYHNMLLPLPLIAREFIKNFDTARPVCAFSFDFEVG